MGREGAAEGREGEREDEADSLEFFGVLAWPGRN